MSEANARIIIDRLLRESGWVLSGDEGVVNFEPELQNKSGVADYVLKDSSDYPLCVIEAKKELVSHLCQTEQEAEEFRSECQSVISMADEAVSHLLLQATTHE
jgi:type I site-specific restriction endonuclease